MWYPVSTSFARAEEGMRFSIGCVMHLGPSIGCALYGEEIVDER